MKKRKKKNNSNRNIILGILAIILLFIFAYYSGGYNQVNEEGLANSGYAYGFLNLFENDPNFDDPYALDENIGNADHECDDDLDCAMGEQCINGMCVIQDLINEEIVPAGIKCYLSNDRADGTNSDCSEYTGKYCNKDTKLCGTLTKTVGSCTDTDADDNPYIKGNIKIEEPYKEDIDDYCYTDPDFGTTSLLQFKCSDDGSYSIRTITKCDCIDGTCTTDIPGAI